MRPMIWKEFRENAKWAALLCIGLCIALGVALSMQSGAYRVRPAQSLLALEVQIVTLCGFALAGLALGLLQTVPELVRDRWSFLLHRPATRTQLFWGKVLAGGGLYVAAAAIPLCGAAIWVATPGHVAAPFDLRILLPGIVDLLLGFVFYFAGMLIALRQARWYASRALPLAAAILVSPTAAVCTEFWQALLIVALAILVFATAAWGTFIAGGQYRPQPNVSKATTGAVLMVAISLVATMLAAGVASMEPQRSYSGAYYSLGEDGRPRIIRNELGDRVARTTVTDLEGHEDPAETARYGVSSFQTSTLVGDWVYTPSYRGPDRYWVVVAQIPQQDWFFVYAQRRFEGFRTRDKHRIGWIGANGFSPDGPESVQPFPPPLKSYPFQPAAILATAEVVFQLDFGGRQFQKIYQPRNRQRVIGATAIYSRSQYQSNVIGSAVATTDEVAVLDLAGKPVLRAPYHYDIRTRSVMIAASATLDRISLWYTPAWYVPHARERQPEYVVELSSTGKEVTRYTLAPLRSWHTESRWYDGVAMGGIPPLLYAVAVTFGMVMKWLGSIESGLEWSEVWQEVWKEPRITWIALCTMAILTAGSFVLCHWITKRYAFSQGGSWFWRIAGVVLGPAALLTLLALHEWPARVSCPSCGQRRRVDRLLCEHCGESFPSPAVRAGDIYDTSSFQGSNEPAQPKALAGSLEGM